MTPSRSTSQAPNVEGVSMLAQCGLPEGRAIVTENVPDFRRLEAAALAHGEPRPGLVFTTNRQFPRGHPATTGRLVVALAALLDAEPEPGTTVFLAQADSN
jgi:hypothetical protein